MVSDTEFEREHGSTESDWLRCLPGAVGPHRLTLGPPGEATVAIGDGGLLHLRWQVLPDRRIALMRMPRLQVHYRFSGALGDDERTRFLRFFDLFLQRGGG